MVGVKQVKTWCIWTCFQCVWWGSKLNHAFFGRKNIVEKRRTDWNPCFLYWFSLKQTQEGIWVEKKSANQTNKILNTFLATKRQKSWSHDKKQKPGLCKIQRWFLLIFRPQTKVSLQNPIVSGMTFEGVFEPSFQCLYIVGGFSWFGFCSAPGPSKSGVGCLDFVGLEVSYSNVFGFVEAVLVFSKNCVYKIWSPNPTRSVFWGIMLAHP